MSTTTPRTARPARAAVPQPAKLPDERDRLSLADHVQLGVAARPARAQRDKPPGVGDPLTLADHVVTRESKWQAAGPPPRVERDQSTADHVEFDDDELDFMSMMQGTDPRVQAAAYDALTRWQGLRKD